MSGLRISIKDARDLKFAKMAQRVTVNATILPSGYCTPARDMVILGTDLVCAECLGHGEIEVRVDGMVTCPSCGYGK